MTTYRDVLMCTVGTSLLSHLNNPGSQQLKAAYEDRNAKGMSLLLLEQPPDARSMGAEINSITSIVNRGRLQGRRRLVFLVSDTADGTFIGQVLRHYYEHAKNTNRFKAVDIHTLEGLTDADAQRFRTEGLRNLVRAIAREVKKESSQRLVINATGGYKAQISFAGMIGQALEIPVCYLFERFSEVIELPPQPISLDVSFWLEQVDTFFALNHNELQENPAAWDEKFNSLVDEIKINGQTLIGLSAVGQLFHETYQHWFELQSQTLLPPPTDISPEKKEIGYEDKNKGKHCGLELYLKKICQVPYVTRINTFYFNPDLPLKLYFRLNARGDIDAVEGGYSDGKATTKFNIFTTATTTLQRNAVLADLSTKFAKE